MSIDFQPSNDKCRRLASCGTDTHVMIWFVIVHRSGEISLEFRSDLDRHTKTVNTVRFSNNGELLASGDDDANVIIWKQVDKDPGDVFEDAIENKEHWVAQKVLRGHIDDVCDVCWSPDNAWLLSGSVDNSAIVWNVEKGKKVSLLNENKGFVQGVAWDPRDVYFTTLSSDRSLRIFKASNKKVAFKHQKALIPHEGLQDKEKATRLFYDDTLKSFCRRLAFSPDGELLVAPCGIIEQDNGRVVNTVYVFARSDLSEPAYYLPVGEKPSLVIRFCPVFFKLRMPDTNTDGTVKGDVEEPLISLPYRMVFAVATQKAILLYDTQHGAPFASISNIHYTRLSDLTWSPDGQVLVASSTDGFCSLITFGEKELGEVYDGPFPFKEVAEVKSDSPCRSKSNSPSEPKSSSAKKENIFKRSKGRISSPKKPEAAKPDIKVDGVIVIDDGDDSVAASKTGNQNGGDSEQTKCNGVPATPCQEVLSSVSGKQEGNTILDKTATIKHDGSHQPGGCEKTVETSDEQTDVSPQVSRNSKLQVVANEEAQRKAQPADTVPQSKSEIETGACQAGDSKGVEAATSGTDDQKTTQVTMQEPAKQADAPKKPPRRVQLVTLCTKKL